MLFSHYHRHPHRQSPTTDRIGIRFKFLGFEFGWIFGFWPESGRMEGKDLIFGGVNMNKAISSSFAITPAFPAPSSVAICLAKKLTAIVPRHSRRGMARSERIANAPLSLSVARRKK